MQIVSNRWYHLYNYVLLGLNGLLVIGFLVTRFVGSLSSYSGKLDLSYFTFTLAAFYLIYMGLYYTVLSHKAALWLASLLGGMVFLLNDINLIVNTHSHLGVIYVVVWLMVVALTGAFGFVVVLSANFLAIAFVLVSSDFKLPEIRVEYGILVFIAYIISIASYFLVWKPAYGHKTEGSSDLNQLSGMLKDKQEQTAILMRSITDGVIVVDINGKITLMNEAAAQMSGWPIQEATGIDIFLVIKLSKDHGAEIPQEANPFTVSLKSGVKVEEIDLVTSRDAKSRIVSLVVSPIVIPKGAGNNENTMVGLVAVMRDVSAQRAAEQQRADFVSTASHEMRTPVAAIEGYLSLALNDKVSSIDSRAREFIEKAYSSTRQLGKLFQDLLTSSKAEDGRLSNHPIVVEMGDFINQLVEALQLAAQKKNIIVDFQDSSTPSDSPWASKVVRPLMYVHVDPERLREVLTNLFDNAVKFTSSGKITIGLGANNETVKFFVRDTGVGIPADDIPHLFQKFYRVDNSAVRTIGGTGLGLYISRKIIELYTGKIWVESEVGKGSTFYIELPRINEQQAKALKVSESVRDQLAMPQANS